MGQMNISIKKIFIILLMAQFISSLGLAKGKKQLRGLDSVSNQKSYIEKTDALLVNEQKMRQRPVWLNNPPRDNGIIYVVGESRNIENKDDSLERAWVSGLLRIGMTQFPELGSLKSASNETLQSAEYKRDYVLALEQINWKGLQEADELGSPFTEFNEESNTYSTYRLLKWTKKEIESARGKIKQKKSFEIPPSPEESLKKQDSIVNEVVAIQAINRKIIERDKFVRAVLLKATCGVSLTDLRKVLGYPDRESPSNDSSYSYELVYYWGTFEVTQYKRNAYVTSINENFGSGTKHYLCINRN